MSKKSWIIEQNFQEIGYIMGFIARLSRLLLVNPMLPRNWANQASIRIKTRVEVFRSKRCEQILRANMHVCI